MKKIVFVSVMLVGLVAFAAAQPRAIGGRFGWGVEASYQHTLGNNFLEIDAGSWWFNDFHAVIVHDWIFASPGWTSRGEWNWYAGVGGGLGFAGLGSNYITRLYFGAAGQIGLEYTFWFPLQLSLDFRPILGPSFALEADSEGHKNVYFYGFNDGSYDGMLSLFSPTLSVRYRF